MRDGPFGTLVPAGHARPSRGRHDLRHTQPRSSGPSAAASTVGCHEPGHLLHRLHARRLHRRRAQHPRLAVRGAPRPRTTAAGTSSSAGVGPLVMGATTYQWVLDHADLLEHPEKWREFYDDRPVLGVHPPRPARHPGRRRPVRRGATSARVRRDGRRRAGKDIWVVGGGDLVGQFDDAGLLDEVSLGHDTGDARRRVARCCPAGSPRSG